MFRPALPKVNAAGEAKASLANQRAGVELSTRQSPTTLGRIPLPPVLEMSPAMVTFTGWPERMSAKQLICQLPTMSSRTLFMFEP